MTLKSPLNPQHMIPNSVEIYVAKTWKDPLMQIGFYKDQDITAAGESSEDPYSNGSIKKTKDGNKVNVKFSLHELTNEKVEILQLGLTEFTTGTVADEKQVIMPGWSFARPVLLKYSNEDGSAVAIESVKALIDGTETDLVKDTDYKVIATPMGATALEFVSGGVLADKDQHGAKITVVYSATADNTKVVDHKANAIAEPFVMVLENRYEYQGNEKVIKTYLDNCQASKAMMKQIADSDATTVGMPIEVTGVIVKEDRIGFSATK